MPAFLVKAVNRNGETVETLRDAPDEKALLKQLQQEGWLPIRIEPAEKFSSSAWFSLSRRRFRIEPKELTLFTRELVTLIGAGLPLDRSLRTLLDLLPPSSPLKPLTERLLDRIKQGSQLSAALEAEGEVFPRLYTALIRAGEMSGKLPAALERLADDLEQLQGLRQQVISALVYPAILAVLAIVSLLALLGFVIPRFEEMFAAAGRELPLPTQIVMGVAQFIRSDGWLLLLLLIGFGFLGRHWLQVEQNRHRFDRWLLKLPLIGNLVVGFNVARMSRTLATLLSSGIPLYQALLIVKETLGNRVLVATIEKAAQKLKEGGEMSRALKETGCFPPLALQMITIGEESGELPKVLERMARLYQEEVSTTLKRLLTLLEPVLILGMGLLIGGIILSVMVAVVSLNDLAF